MLPILFKIGPITVYSFGFFLTLAYFAATFILWREGKRQGYNEEKLLDLSVISLVAALAGGRAYYVLLNWNIFTEEPMNAFSFWQGGFAYHGALFFVFVTAIYFVRRWKWSLFQIADIAAISATAALILSKIGIFLSSLDVGKESGLPWAVQFPDLVGARHPAQLYEAAAYLLIFLLLYVIYFRNLAAPNMRSGKVFFTFLISTSIARALLESFRADSHTVFSFPTASVLSLVIATASLIALYYFQIRDIRSDVRNFLGFFFGLNTKVLRKIKF